MHLSLSTLIVIVTIMASIVSIASKEEDKKMKIHNASKSERSNSNEFHSRMMKNSPISRRICRISEPRKARMTYVKAILSNPKISASRHLAEKLARAELKSAKMRETLKKLTTIHAPKKKARVKSSRSKVSNRYKLLRLKNAKKRKKIRGKNGRAKGGKLKNSHKRKSYNSRRRLAREIANKSSGNGDEISKERYEKSIDYRPDENLENFNNDESSRDDPYVNLNTGINYPGVDDFDANLQKNSPIDDNNPLNYVNDYLPIKDQMDAANMENSLSDNIDDISLTNDRSSIDKLIASDDNFDEKIGYNSKYENPMESMENQYTIADEKNPSEDPEMGKNPNFQAPKTLDSRKYVSPLNSKYPTGSTFIAKEREKNRVFESKKNHDVSSQPENTTEIDISTAVFGNVTKKSSIDDNASVTTKNISTTNDGKILRTRKASKMKKSEQTMETSMISMDVGNSTTTEMNPKIRGIGEASIVTPETIDQNSMDRSKYIENHLFETNDDLEREDSTDKFTDIANETKVVAGQILNKIIEELEDLKIDRNINSHREGLPCKLTGSWITTLAGVRIDMLVTNRSVNISMAKLDLPVGIIRQGLLNYTWNITGYAPFRRGGPFSIVATDNRTKSLAAFVGACRVCQGVDTIEGVWSIAREPRDCRDFQMATSIHNDIFRRTELLSAIKEKQFGIPNPAKYGNASISLAKDEYSSANLGNTGVS